MRKICIYCKAAFPEWTRTLNTFCSPECERNNEGGWTMKKKPIEGDGDDDDDAVGFFREDNPVSVKTRGKSKSFTKQAVQTSTAQAPKLVGWVDTRVVLSGQHEW